MVAHIFTNLAVAEVFRHRDLQGRGREGVNVPQPITPELETIVKHMKAPDETLKMSF